MITNIKLGVLESISICTFIYLLHLIRKHVLRDSFIFKLNDVRPVQLGPTRIILSSVPLFARRGL